MEIFLDFEKPIVDLEGRIKELSHLSSEGNEDAALEIASLEKKINEVIGQIYSRLAPWQKVLVSRHPKRPHFNDYIGQLIDDYVPLSGDRYYGDDRALLGGIGNFRGTSVVVIGQEKGSDTKSRLYHNFGMAHPEGYRKSVRLMELANKFKLPVLTFIDTTGAYPGVEAEERGQAQAIAKSIEACLSIESPIISTVIGEGGSGGAVALAVGDAILMLEHSIYSVISPEGCASILWRTAEKAKDAADSLKLTAEDLLHLNVIDSIVGEPLGGAHRNPIQAIKNLGDALEEELIKLKDKNTSSYKEDRRKKFLKMGRLTIT